MAHYRIYLLNDDGSIASGNDASCDSDKAACELAQRMVAVGIQAEVWCGARSLGRVSAALASDVVTLARDWERDVRAYLKVGTARG